MTGPWYAPEYPGLPRHVGGAGAWLGLTVSWCFVDTVPTPYPTCAALAWCYILPRDVRAWNAPGRLVWRNQHGEGRAFPDGSQMVVTDGGRGWIWRLDAYDTSGALAGTVYRGRSE